MPVLGRGFMVLCAGDESTGSKRRGGSPSMFIHHFGEAHPLSSMVAGKAGEIDQERACGWLKRYGA